MLKHLPEKAKEFLLNIINKIWETGILPRSWKIALIIPIKKPNKDALLTDSYRPIALTSCICKLMEKMINTRLVWYLESNSLLSPYQFGFRKNRSTLDPLMNLTNQIQQGFVKQQQTIGVFFDLEKAYDTTWRFGIIKQLHKMGIRGKMIRFINSFLSERFIKVKIGNRISKAFPQEEGVPQGSILSVTCFAVAINSIIESVTPPVKGSLFVDDFALYCTGYDALSVCRYLQKSINAVSRWAENNGFKFSTSKTVAIRFTRRKLEEIPTLTLNGSILPYEKEVKFLGMTFDEKLTWKSHIDKLKITVKQSLNILKVVSSFSWGADKKSLLRIYDSVCRSKLDYGCQIYSSACKSKLKELDIIHNMGLRICSGAFRTSPIESIYVDCGERPLELRREELGLRYTMRLKTDAKNPAFNILKECSDNNFGSRSSKPFQIRQLEKIENTTVHREKVLSVQYPSAPPWFVPEATCCPRYINKKTNSEDEIRAKFLEHDNKAHSNQKKLYTDGSKTENGVGCAVVYEDTVYSGKLPNTSSVFTAEMTAIIQALEVVDKSSHKEFVIYSDSRSALDSLNQYNSFHPLIQKAQQWLFRLSCRHKSISFCWVPAHVGILGNEKADQEAKYAATFNNITRKKVPHCDLKSPIRFYILNKWQEQWSSPLLANNKKYKSIRKSISPWPSSFQRSRRTEVVLTRLRIGHTYLTHNFILEGSNAPECACCDSLLTIEHILVHCPRYRNERNNHVKGRNITDILGEEVDVNGIIEFLKEIGIFNKV